MFQENQTFCRLRQGSKDGEDRYYDFGQRSLSLTGGTDEIRSGLALWITQEVADQSDNRGSVGIHLIALDESSSLIGDPIFDSQTVGLEAGADLLSYWTAVMDEFDPRIPPGGRARNLLVVDGARVLLCHENSVTIVPTTTTRTAKDREWQ